MSIDNSLTGMGANGESEVPLRRHRHRLLRASVAFRDWCLSGHPPLERFLVAWTRRRPEMGARDRRFLARILYRVARERVALLTGSHPRPAYASADPLVLVAGACWMEEDESPTEEGPLIRAAVEEVLEAPPDRPWGRLPSEWIAAFGRRFPPSDAEEVMRVLNRPASTYDLRVNVARLGVEEARRLLLETGVQAVATPHAPWGLRLSAGVDIRSHHLYRTGQIEIQDESSQVTSLLALPPPRGRVLDYCAGAGGKTLAIASALGRGGGRIGVHDVDPRRLDELERRGRRAGWSFGLVTRGALTSEDEGSYDVVLVDAPCSGSGTLRRAPHLLWRPLDLEQRANRARDILRRAAAYVKPGGVLVYVTCSLFAEEGMRVAEIFEREGRGRWLALDPTPRLEEGGVRGVEALVRDQVVTFLPHRQGTDGMEARVWLNAGA